MVILYSSVPNKPGVFISRRAEGEAGKYCKIGWKNFLLLCVLAIAWLLFSNHYAHFYNVYYLQCLFLGSLQLLTKSNFKDKTLFVQFSWNLSNVRTFNVRRGDRYSSPKSNRLMNAVVETFTPKKTTNFRISKFSGQQFLQKPEVY